ncbi:MAG: hypothetical protein WEB63_03660 [Cucumibacter sp.]
MRLDNVNEKPSTDSCEDFWARKVFVARSRTSIDRCIRDQPSDTHVARRVNSNQLKVSCKRDIVATRLIAFKASVMAEAASSGPKKWTHGDVRPAAHVETILAWTKPRPSRAEAAGA